ncbi:hypothetical protein J6590_099531 [Homalodisca vitripennis]|nr:hypothetical protein J6590_099531 [Homalodisca vitripennis]
MVFYWQFANQPEFNPPGDSMPFANQSLAECSNPGVGVCQAPATFFGKNVPQINGAVERLELDLGHNDNYRLQ